MDDAIISNMRVRWFALGILDQEFLRLSNGDLALSCSAMFFVFAYIWFHTGSLWLTSTAMAQILLSLPVAFFIYRVIFQITFFTQLHILAVFLVLGVGADDVFVCVVFPVASWSCSVRVTVVVRGSHSVVCAVLWTLGSRVVPRAAASWSGCDSATTEPHGRCSTHLSRRRSRSAPLPCRRLCLLAPSASTRHWPSF